jgi:hypothetical protein
MESELGRFVQHSIRIPGGTAERRPADRPEPRGRDERGELYNRGDGAGILLARDGGNAGADSGIRGNGREGIVKLAALLAVVVLTISLIGGFLYLVSISPDGKPDATILALFLGIAAPTIASLVAAWRANQAVAEAMKNREGIRQIQHQTNGGLTRKLNEQTRKLISPRVHRGEETPDITPTESADIDYDRGRR